MPDPSRCRFARAVGAAHAIALSWVAILPQSSLAQQDWEARLRQQLLEEQRCELTFLSRVREFELAGERVVEGRAHCTDGRAFDIARKGQGAVFTLRLCGPVEC